MNATDILSRDATADAIIAALQAELSAAELTAAIRSTNRRDSVSGTKRQLALRVFSLRNIILGKSASNRGDSGEARANA